MSPTGVPDAIRRSMRILTTHRALFGRRGDGVESASAMSEADIARVVDVFEMCSARWTLVGAHAVNLVTEPRTTSDFDFVIEDGELRAVIHGLTGAFGELGAQDIGAAIQLKAIDVDLIRSITHPLLQAALHHTRSIGTWHVPRTEVLVVLRFVSAHSPQRQRFRRMQDLADLISMYEVAHDELDRALMVELSRLIDPGAEREFIDLLDKVDRDEPIAM